MIDPLKDALTEELQNDPFVQAMKLTGKHYKEDEATNLLGGVLALRRNEDKDALLNVMRDTTFRNSLEYYLEIAQEIGFKVAYKEPFHSKKYNYDNYFYLLYRNPGILLVFDTFWEENSVNGAKFYYNWLPHDWEEYTKAKAYLTSSGCWNKLGDKLVWSGDFDAREALRYKIGNLDQYGDFLEPWLFDPHFNICIYEDYYSTEHIEKEQGYKARWEVLNNLQKVRFSAFPEGIKQIAKNCSIFA